ncbi:MAG: Ldh family oxidoreductase, partial [Burkholderiaceae bacterium]
VILDYATSMVAQGKMRVAHNKGEEVRPGMLIDQHGHPTTNPSVVVVEPLGALLTFGEHKGFGMALVCELLGGALSGGGTWHKTYQGEKKVYNGMLSILIDPKRLDQDDHFFKESEAFMNWLRSVPVAPGFDKVRIAGEPEREAMAIRSKEGFPVDPTTWQEILAAAEKLKLPRAEVEQAAMQV